jgi:hypothetical protein
MHLQYSKNISIVSRDSGFWAEDAYGVLLGPIGSIEEITEALEKLNPAEYETKMFLKNSK